MPDLIAAKAAPASAVIIHPFIVPEINVDKNTQTRPDDNIPDTGIGRVSLAAGRIESWQVQ